MAGNDDIDSLNQGMTNMVITDDATKKGSRGNRNGAQSGFLKPSLPDDKTDEISESKDASPRRNDARLKNTESEAPDEIGRALLAGNVVPLLREAEKTLDLLSNNDHQHFNETGFKAILLSILRTVKGVKVTSELEVQVEKNGRTSLGYVDLLIEPQTKGQGKVLLIELKYTPLSYVLHKSESSSEKVPFGDPVALFKYFQEQKKFIDKHSLRTLNVQQYQGPGTIEHFASRTWESQVMIYFEGLRRAHIMQESDVPILVHGVGHRTIVFDSSTILKAENLRAGAVARGDVIHVAKQQTHTEPRRKDYGNSYIPPEEGNCSSIGWYFPDGHVDSLRCKLSDRSAHAAPGGNYFKEDDYW